MNNNSYNKIAIIGGPGTGKTTLANILSKKFNISATHIDGIHHLPNWQVRDKNERDKIILNLIEKEKWIIDGTYKSTLQARLEKANLIIWLDYPTSTQIKGILKRCLKNKNQEKPEIPGCKEHMTKEFFLYTLNYRKKQRQYITDALLNIDSSKIIAFKKQKELNRWLKNNLIL